MGGISTLSFRRLLGEIEMEEWESIRDVINNLELSNAPDELRWALTANKAFNTVFYIELSCLDVLLILGNNYGLWRVETMDPGRLPRPARSPPPQPPPWAPTMPFGLSVACSAPVAHRRGFFTGRLFPRQQLALCASDRSLSLPFPDC